MKKTGRGTKMNTVVDGRSLRDRIESIGQLLEEIEKLLDEIEEKGKKE